MRFACRFCAANLANGITLLRIVLAAHLPVVAPFSRAFWACYILGAVSDAADGAIARALKKQSAMGAMLDSLADAAFMLSVVIVFAWNIAFPAWLLALCGCALLLRLAAYMLGFFRFHSFVSIHTHANKLVGALLLLSPVLYSIVGSTATGIVVGTAACLSAAEELLINATAKAPDRGRKGLLQG